MNGVKRDWNTIWPLVEQLVRTGTIESWSDLARRVSGHVGVISSQTLKRGIERGYGQRFSSIDLLASFVRGEGTAYSPLAQTLLDMLTREGQKNIPASALDLSNALDRSPNSIMAAAQELRDANYNIRVTDDSLLISTVIPASCTRIPVEMWTEPDRIHRYGLLSDTHLSNRNARLDVLETLYDIYEEEGIATVLHCGNLVDGECNYNRHELDAHGVEGQIRYAAKHYPQREGICTKFISADDHEGWWARIGLDIGQHMGSQFIRLDREDLIWIGHVEVDLSLHDDNKGAVLRLMHPGGGTAYATSYSPQKHVEAWQGGEKPAVACFGHYHKVGHFYPREVHTFLTGCVEDQTMWMRKKKLPAHVGGWIIEIHLSDIGSVLRVKGEFFPFYNRQYYHDWSYGGILDG